MRFTAHSLSPARTLKQDRVIQFASIVLCLLLTVLCCGCYRKPSINSTSSSSSTSTRAESRSTFKATCDNVEPSVRYVSNQQCAECHEEIAQQFARHPMGNSLLAVHDSETSKSRLSKLFNIATNGELSAVSAKPHIQYASKLSDDLLVHTQSVLPRASDLAEAALAKSHRIAYVVGSGQRGQSYLIEDDHHLFMSPLTWYPRKEVWDLSPGYEHNDLGFTRPVLEDCLFCHSNRANLVPEQKNKYAEPVFTEHSIGCQRCHGPGELHVRKHSGPNSVVGVGDHTGDSAVNTSDYDRSIANPARMSPAIRDDVCFQCHLAGAARIPKANKSRYDYRPGTPLEDTIATYILNPALPRHAEHFVGQVEQMLASRCYTLSDGKLGCISCHDPHSAPEPSDKVAFYRERCLRCHDEDACVQPLNKRVNANGEDDCIGCHMPPMKTDVRHASTTNHRVPRISASNNETERSALAVTGPSSRKRTPIVGFPERNPNADSAPATSLRARRDYALALLEASTYHPHMLDANVAGEQAQMLTQYVTRNPSDLEAQDALGDLLIRSGQVAHGFEHFRKLHMQRPHREHSAVMLANLCLNHGRFEMAAELWKTIVEQHGSVPVYRSKLCEAYERQGRWRDLQRVAEIGTREFPISDSFWRYLATASAILGDTDKANHALRCLVRIQPEHEAAIRQWFGDLTDSNGDASVP